LSGKFHFYLYQSTHRHPLYVAQTSIQKTWIVNFLHVFHSCCKHFSNMKHEMVYAYIQYNNLMYHELGLSKIFKLSDAWLITYNHTYLFSLDISELSKLPGRNRISRNTVSPNGLEMEFCDLISDDNLLFQFLTLFTSTFCLIGLLLLVCSWQVEFSILMWAHPVEAWCALPHGCVFWNRSITSNT